MNEQAMVKVPSNVDLRPKEVSNLLRRAIGQLNYVIANTCGEDLKSTLTSICEITKRAQDGLDEWREAKKDCCGCGDKGMCEAGQALCRRPFNRRINQNEIELPDVEDTI